MSIVLIAAAFYLLAAWLVMRRLQLRRGTGAGFWLLTPVSALTLHALFHVLAWRAGLGVDLHFFSALSLVGLGMAALTTLFAASGRMGALAATYVLENMGTQNHSYTPQAFVARYREQFDDEGQLDRLLQADPALVSDY